MISTLGALVGTQRGFPVAEFQPKFSSCNHSFPVFNLIALDYFISLLYNLDK